MNRLPSAYAASEHATQVAIIRYLDKVLPKSVRVVAVSNNPRSRVSGGKEKARGMRKGFPDLILIGESIMGLIEVKKEGGRLAPEQREWRDWCGSHLIPYAVCRSVDDVAETLKAWEVLR